MAGEDYGAGSQLQSPFDWLGFGFNYAGGNVTLPVAVDTTKGFTTGTLDDTTGDVRAAYHAIIDTLFEKYNTKDTTSDFVMPTDMVMSRSEILDPATDDKTTVYTFRIKQSFASGISGGHTAATASGNASYDTITN